MSIQYTHNSILKHNAKTGGVPTIPSPTSKSQSQGDTSNHTLSSPLHHRTEPIGPHPIPPFPTHCSLIPSTLISHTVPPHTVLAIPSMSLAPPKLPNGFSKSKLD